MGTFLIDGRLYAFMVNNGAANLGRHRDTVNKLNVFPIPDGDTGDNMFLTIRSGAVLDHAILDKNVIVNVGRQLIGYDGIPLVFRKNLTV